MPEGTALNRLSDKVPPYLADASFITASATNLWAETLAIPEAFGRFPEPIIEIGGVLSPEIQSLGLATGQVITRSDAADAIDRFRVEKATPYHPADSPRPWPRFRRGEVKYFYKKVVELGPRRIGQDGKLWEPPIFLGDSLVKGDTRSFKPLWLCRSWRGWVAGGVGLAGVASLVSSLVFGYSLIGHVARFSGVSEENTRKIELIAGAVIGIVGFGTSQNRLNILNAFLPSLLLITSLFQIKRQP